MREKLQRFMMGRYGTDDFSKFLSIIVIILCVIDILFIDSLAYYLCTLALISYLYFRMFSRNINKRYRENQLYLTIKNRITRKWRQRKTHHIYKCPTCRQKIRIPRGKGRICITCPKCKTEFTKTS